MKTWQIVVKNRTRRKVFILSQIHKRHQQPTNMTTKQVHVLYAKRDTRRKHFPVILFRANWNSGIKFVHKKVRLMKNITLRICIWIGCVRRNNCRKSFKNLKRFLRNIFQPDKRFHLSLHSKWKVSSYQRNTIFFLL